MEQDQTLTTICAKDHFMAVADGNIPAAIMELEDALDEAFILMHRRAFYKLNGARNKWLGIDVYAQQIEAEWDALTSEQQKAIESSGNGYGKYGMFDSISRQEVPLALIVAAKLLSPEFEISAHKREKFNPEMVERIVQRFPLIKEADIAKALELS